MQVKGQSSELLLQMTNNPWLIKSLGLREMIKNPALQTLWSVAGQIPVWQRSRKD